MTGFTGRPPAAGPVWRLSSRIFLPLLNAPLDASTRRIIFLSPQGQIGLGIGCRRVSGALVSMLLSGGCGHENLRLFSPLPLDHRLRPAVRHARPDGAWRIAPNWPPYNIERTSEDDYRITMALAGFAPDEIELVQKENTLFVAGHKNTDQEQGAEVLHRGIATRSFRQSFNSRST